MVREGGHSARSPGPFALAPESYCIRGTFDCDGLALPQGGSGCNIVVNIIAVNRIKAHARENRVCSIVLGGDVGRDRVMVID